MMDPLLYMKMQRDQLRDQQRDHPVACTALHAYQ